MRAELCELISAMTLGAFAFLLYAAGCVVLLILLGLTYSTPPGRRWIESGAWDRPNHPDERPPR